MLNSIRAQVFAKVNIGLSIGSPLGSGYHPIASIFQSVDLSDTIDVSIGNGNGGVTVCGEFDCDPQETTVFKAAALFRERNDIREAMEFTVCKGIPAKSGLGGGSADAAGTLLALVRAYGIETNIRELTTMGSLIGSDVPFFIHGGAAFVSGRGEVVSPIHPRTDYAIALVFPGFGIGTAWAFARLDELRSRHVMGAPKKDFSDNEFESYEAEFRIEPSSWRFRNDFYNVVSEYYPVYNRLREVARTTGACFESLTGSGSCWYGLYRDMEKAERILPIFLDAVNEGNREGTSGSTFARAVKPLETSIILRYN
jgi:4-diphosphocytidyl-2-C-methyl-D-erythritol kinase